MGQEWDYSNWECIRRANWPGLWLMTHSLITIRSKTPDFDPGDSQIHCAHAVSSQGQHSAEFSRFRTNLNTLYFLICYITTSICSMQALWLKFSCFHLDDNRYFSHVQPTCYQPGESVATPNSSIPTLSPAVATKQSFQLYSYAQLANSHIIAFMPFIHICLSVKHDVGMSITCTSATESTEVTSSFFTCLSKMHVCNIEEFFYILMLVMIRTG